MKSPVYSHVTHILDKIKAKRLSVTRYSRQALVLIMTVTVHAAGSSFSPFGFLLKPLARMLFI